MHMMEHLRSFTYPPNGFDVGSVLVWSLLLYLFTWYLRVDKNNTLSIFMLSGFIQLSLHFSLKSNHAMFIK